MDTPPQPQSTENEQTARERLRQHWLSFPELAGNRSETMQRETGKKRVDLHRTALDELVGSGEISAAVADLLQDVYSASVFHIWRSKSSIMCYRIVEPSHRPVSADALLEQANALRQIATEGTVDPATLAKVQAALERDLSFYTLNEAEVQTLYDQFRTASEASGQGTPMFDELTLELTPKAQAARRFIMDLLTGK